MHARKAGTGRIPQRGGHKPRKPYFPPQLIQSVPLHEAAEMADDCPARR